TRAAAASRRHARWRIRGRGAAYRSCAQGRSERRRKPFARSHRPHAQPPPPLTAAAKLAPLQLPAMNLDRPGTTIDDPTLGLTLSGGGAFGAAHVGVLQVLEERGIRPGIVT